MCRWTNSLISLTLDEVCEVPMEDACMRLNIGDDLLTMVVLNLEGEIGGSMILTFDENDGRQLAASLLQIEPNPGPDWNELEQSALTETGNILGCAYVNAITRLIDHELLPSAPYFVRDYGASVVQQALVAQAAARDTVLICRTCFHNDRRRIEVVAVVRAFRRACDGDGKRLARNRVDTIPTVDIQVPHALLSSCVHRRSTSR